MAARSLCSLVCLVRVSGMQRGEAVNPSLMLPSDLCKFFFFKMRQAKVSMLHTKQNYCEGKLLLIITDCLEYQELCNVYFENL